MMADLYARGPISHAAGHRRPVLLVDISVDRPNWDGLMSLLKNSG
jgi:hypothetical protein